MVSSKKLVSRKLEYLRSTVQSIGCNAVNLVEALSGRQSLVAGTLDSAAQETLLVAKKTAAKTLQVAKEDAEETLALAKEVARELLAEARNHIGVVDGGSWYLLCSLSAQDRARFDAWLPAAGLNAVTQAKMSCTTQQLEALTTCRHCGALASFRPRDGAFKAECASCKTEWGIYSTSSGRVARMRTADQNEVSFVRFGSWSIEFRLD